MSGESNSPLRLLVEQFVRDLSALVREQAFENIARALREPGAAPAPVVKVTAPSLGRSKPSRADAAAKGPAQAKPSRLPKPPPSSARLVGRPAPAGSHREAILRCLVKPATIAEIRDTLDAAGHVIDGRVLSTALYEMKKAGTIVTLGKRPSTRYAVAGSRG